MTFFDLAAKIKVPEIAKTWELDPAKEYICMVPVKYAEQIMSACSEILENTVSITFIFIGDDEEPDFSKVMGEIKGTVQ